MRAAYIKEGTDGIESFVKGMVIISFAPNDCEPQSVLQTSFSGVQSKQILEDRVNNKPIFRRR